MIVIERTYTARKIHCGVSKDVTETERKAFEDTDIDGVQAFIQQEGRYKYIKL